MTRIVKSSPDTLLRVNGDVSTCCLTKRKKGKSISYNSIVIYNAQILNKIPGHITVEELYLHYAFYPSRLGGFGFAALNASETNPQIYKTSRKAKQFIKTKLREELPRDTNVTLELRTSGDTFILESVFINDDVSSLTQNIAS